MNNINNLWFRLELDKIYPEILDDVNRENIIYQEYINKLDLLSNINVVQNQIEINNLSILKYKIGLIRKQLKEKSHSNEFKTSLDLLINNLKLDIITNRSKRRDPNKE